MPQYVITPWKYHSELLQVRRQLFQLENGSPSLERRRDAVNQIRRWKIRGNLPHAVESTANFVDAILHDDITKHSAFTIRSAYSLAFCRFVTGFCDIGQNMARKRSMFEVAAEIGMPNSFVEVRHEITHGEMPSLQLLQSYSQKALSWLWRIYWVDLEELRSPDSDATYPQPTDVQLRTILSEYRTRRAEDIRQRNGDLSSESTPAVACVEIIKLCLGKEMALEILAKVLLEEKMLIPSGRKLGDSMDIAFLMWDNLLRRLTFYQTLFLKILVAEMAEEIVQVSSTDGLQDARMEAIYEWLLHIFRTWRHTKLAKRFVGLSDFLVGECATAMNEWSQALAKKLIVDGDEAFQEQWKPLFDIDGMDIDE